MDRNTSDGTNQNGERIAYLVSEELIRRNALDAINLADLLRILWSGKWIVLGVTATFMLAAGCYALFATQWYRADVLLAPASNDMQEQNASGLSALGGLASLAGIGGADQNDAEPIAVLQSRDFIRAFISKYDLMPVLLSSQWDSERKRWKSSDPGDRPDIRDAVRYFRKHVIDVSQDSNTKLVTVSINWTDPKLAAVWANVLVARLNRDMQQRALAQAQFNVKYLKQQLSQTSLTSLQQSIVSLLETQLRRVMLARGNKEFAFRVVDSAQPPKWPEKPRRALVMAGSFVLGVIVSVLWVFGRRAFTQERIASSDEQ